MKSDKQRRAFFARLADAAHNIQDKAHQFQEDRRKKAEQKLERQTKMLILEEQKLKRELAVETARAQRSRRVEQLKAQVAHAKHVKFQHTAAGRILDQAKSDAARIGKFAKKQIKKQF